MANLDWSQCSAVESIPGKVSGAWLFRGTRVPAPARDRVQTVLAGTQGSYAEVEIPPSKAAAHFPLAVPIRMCPLVTGFLVEIRIAKQADSRGQVAPSPPTPEAG